MGSRIFSLRAAAVILPLGVIVLALSLLFLLSSPASAHQSGCHRWHSCPSDTGSYVCGDTGHSNYCGGIYFTPTPTPYHASISVPDYNDGVSGGNSGPSSSDGNGRARDGTVQPQQPTPPVSNRDEGDSDDEDDDEDDDDSEPVQPTPTPLPLPISNDVILPAQPFLGIGDVTTEVLNVRTGPGKHHTLVGTLSRGDHIRVLERNNGWLRIEYSGTNDKWVSAEFVNLPESPGYGGPIEAALRPILITPKDRAIFHDKITFDWEWSGSLAAGQGFDVQVWKDGDYPAGIQHSSFVVAAGGNRYMLPQATLPFPKGFDYHWRVRVVEIATGVDVAQPSYPETFRYE